MVKQRKIVLINKKFQLRFAFYVCSWLIVLSFAYPLIIANVFDNFLQYLAQDPMMPSIKRLQDTRNEVLTLLALMEVTLIGITFLISIFMSHKIAGPLYKLTKTLREGKEGHVVENLRFRKKDYFQEIVPEYNGFVDYINKRLTYQSQRAQMAASLIEKVMPTATSEAQKELAHALELLKAVQKK